MFEPQVKEIKKLFIPKEKDEPKKETPKTVESPMVDGKRFIGSGEDAHLYTSPTS